MKKILIFGGTGMVGQGVLRECLRDSSVVVVQTIGRKKVVLENPKLRQLELPDLFHYEAVENQITGFDACFFCLGVSSRGLSESEYTHVTYDLTLAAAKTLCRLNPEMTFVYVSGSGTDSSEKGRSMWARVKGKTENELLKLPFKKVSLFRPGVIEPVNGEQSKTAMYRFFYSMSKPVLPLLRTFFPNQVLTTEQIGRAMIRVATVGSPKAVLESRDIRALT